MVTAFTMGPGTLTFDAGAQVATAQVTNCRIEVTESTSGGDTVPLLDGSELVEAETASRKYALAGNVVQDLDAAGFAAFTWAEEGNDVTFVFTPNTVEAASFAGTVTIVPLNIGGDVKTKPRSDFTFRCTAKPVPTWG